MKRALLLLALLAAPAAARDSLGVFNDWGAFRDPRVPRCYAIAMPSQVPGRARDFQPYVTVGHWPQRALRGAVHVRVARRLAAGAPVTLSIGGQSFNLSASQADAWPKDAQMNAAIVAAMRSATQMAVVARAADGRTFRDTYRLAGAATAMDAAALACAKR